MLVIIHELGHFLTARFFGVTIKEFAVGMGPKIFSHVSKKSNIRYSLRLLPFGGFVSMAGEDETSDDKNALTNKPVWQRLIIMAAGSVMNMLFGFLIVFALVIASDSLGDTQINYFVESSQTDSYGLQAGDIITKVNGKRVHIADQLAYEILFEGVDPIDITLIRNGETLIVKNVVFPTETNGGMTFGTIDFKVCPVDKSIGSVIKFTFWRSVAYVNLIWRSLVYLVSGKIGLESVSGPVGVTAAIGDAAKNGLSQLGFLCSIIALNLGIFNLFPLPALDGGRMVFLIIEFVRGKPIKRETEGMIHFVGLAILMLLMVVIAFKDIIQLFSR